MKVWASFTKLGKSSSIRLSNIYSRSCWELTVPCCFLGHGDSLCVFADPQDSCGLPCSMASSYGYGPHILTLLKAENLNKASPLLQIPYSTSTADRALQDMMICEAVLWISVPCTNQDLDSQHPGGHCRSYSGNSTT